MYNIVVVEISETLIEHQRCDFLENYSHSDRTHGTTRVRKKKIAKERQNPFGKICKQ